MNNELCISVRATGHLSGTSSLGQQWSEPKLPDKESASAVDLLKHSVLVWSTFISKVYLHLPVKDEKPVVPYKLSYNGKWL